VEANDDFCNFGVESKRAQEDRIGKGKETRKDARDPLRRHKRSNCYSNILIKRIAWKI
jgi:hypothetical protein